MRVIFAVVLLFAVGCSAPPTAEELAAADQAELVLQENVNTADEIRRLRDDLKWEIDQTVAAVEGMRDDPGVDQADIDSTQASLDRLVQEYEKRGAQLDELSEDYAAVLAFVDDVRSKGTLDPEGALLGAQAVAQTIGGPVGIIGSLILGGVAAGVRERRRGNRNVIAERHEGQRVARGIVKSVKLAMDPEGNSIDRDRLGEVQGLLGVRATVREILNA